MFKNPRIIFCFSMYTKRIGSQLKKKMGAKRPKSLVLLKNDRETNILKMNKVFFNKRNTFNYVNSFL